MADDREPLGRAAFGAHVGALAEQEQPPWQDKPPAWEELSDGDREFYMRIGSAVAVQAVHDAGLENTRRDAQLFALGAHLPAVLDALRLAVADTEHGSRAKRYKAALEALGGSEERPS